MNENYTYDHNDIGELEPLEMPVSNGFIKKAFVHMVFGIIVTACSSLYLLIFNHGLLSLAINNFRLVALLQLGVVFALSFFIKKLSYTAMFALFYLYSAMTGITFACVGLIFTPLSILYTFGITLTLFIILAVYGYRTQEDLTGYGKYLRIGLLALIILSIANFFLKASAVYWLGTVAGVAIFILLIAYDVNRIKKMSYDIIAEDPEAVNKLGIMMALNLYLDFVNLFLYLIRIIGRRRR